VTCPELRRADKEDKAAALDKAKEIIKAHGGHLLAAGGAAGSGVRVIPVEEKAILGAQRTAAKLRSVQMEAYGGPPPVQSSPSA
jgi:uncharacterized protein (DUF1330 family)